MNDNRERELQAYRRGAASLLGLIRSDRADSPSARDRRARAEAKLERSRALLAALGKPQDNYPVVHVTGTSGKGSTSASIAAILTAAGYRVGLRTSPYLQVPTEKAQIGSSLIDAYALERLAREVIATGEHLLAQEDCPGRLGYAEVWTALSFLWFAEQEVDLAVIEVGAGGRFDSTNVMNPVVSVITSVGLDHVVSLGPTLADIAWHKAGIIKPGSTAVLGHLPDPARSIIEAEARAQGAPIIGPPTESRTTDWQPGMAGQFQVANALLASSAVQALGRYGYQVPDAAIREGWRGARLPGRLELMPHGPAPVWIDGAHNPDKISAVAHEASRLTPDGALPVIVLGLLQAKDSASIVSTVAPVASAIVVTQPSVVGKVSRDAGDLEIALRAWGYRGPIDVDPDPISAVIRAEDRAAANGTSVLVTGSMYLAGETRRRWYPDDDVVLERTPWPSLAEHLRPFRAISGLEREEPNGQDDQSTEQQILASIDKEAVRLER